MHIVCTITSTFTGRMQIEDEVDALSDTVDEHLKKMGVWS